MREPRYGELDSARQGEAYRIWLTRDDEPPPCPPHPLPFDSAYVDEPYCALSFVEWVCERLTPKQAKVVRFLYEQDCTVVEVAKILDVSRTRVDQIHAKALRVARLHLRRAAEEGLRVC